MSCPLVAPSGMVCRTSTSPLSMTTLLTSTCSIVHPFLSDTEYVSVSSSLDRPQSLAWWQSMLGPAGPVPLVSNVAIGGWGIVTSARTDHTFVCPDVAALHLLSPASSLQWFTVTPLGSRTTSAMVGLNWIEGEPLLAVNHSLVTPALS